MKNWRLCKLIYNELKKISVALYILGNRVASKCNSGPLSSKYEQYLRGINVTPEAYHGVSLTGVRAGYLVKANHTQFWTDHFYKNE